MDITTEHIGAVICRHDTGERFLVTDVSSSGFSIRNEDGTRSQCTSHAVNGEVVVDENQIQSFHQNLKLAQSLSAAEQAAQRRLSSSHPDKLASEEASRVSRIIQEQRQAFLDRLCTECDARKAQHPQSFDDILKLAKGRLSNQQQKQPNPPFDFKR